jgi:hypothetical protein
VSPGLSTFGKYGLETMFLGLPWALSNKFLHFPKAFPIYLLLRLQKNNTKITKTINNATGTTTAIAIIVPLESSSLRVTSLGGLEPVDVVGGFVMEVPVGMTSDVVCLVEDVFGPIVATAVGLMVGSIRANYYLTFCRVHSNRVKMFANF